MYKKSNRRRIVTMNDNRKGNEVQNILGENNARRAVGQTVHRNR